MCIIGKIECMPLGARLVGVHDQNLGDDVSNSEFYSKDIAFKPQNIEIHNGTFTLMGSFSRCRDSRAVMIEIGIKRGSWVMWEHVEELPF